MKFKKVYIEITNNCNLSCSFCKNNKREKKFMTKNQFNTIVEKIKPYTKYVYLHVKGEPLLHPDLDEILKICDTNDLLVNITTNGTLLKNKQKVLLQHKCIRQINVSLHCEQDLPNYYENVFSCCKELAKNIYISYRLWTLNNYKLDKKSTIIVDKITDFYHLSTGTVEKLYNDASIKIDNNTFVDKENLFSWPDLNSDDDSNGFCYGLKTHIGILVDGTVVPCCLDGEGIITLGNIYDNSLDDILNSNRTKRIIEGFKNNKCSEKLCLKCKFKNRFKGN